MHAIEDTEIVRMLRQAWQKIRYHRAALTARAECGLRRKQLPSLALLLVVVDGLRALRH